VRLCAWRVIRWSKLPISLLLVWAVGGLDGELPLKGPRGKRLISLDPRRWVLRSKEGHDGCRGITSNTSKASQDRDRSGSP
jgi:hypothetical protein